MTITVPGDALVVLVGISGSGKSTFAATHFAPSEVLSSDAFRRLVSDDEADQSASTDAFALLHHATDIRLRRGRLTVIDATNVQRWARDELLAIAARHGRPAISVVLDLPVAVCLDRVAGRSVRVVPPPAVRQQGRALRRGLATLALEGFSEVVRLGSQLDVDAARLVRLASGDEKSRRNRARPDDARSSDRHRNA